MSEMPHSETVLKPGDLVDHFKVVRMVGRGGMGEVYLARDTKLGRKVALKVIRPEMLGDKDAVERFLFEARVTARFSHPHIVTIHAVGEQKGCPYVALEYLEGQTLRERIADQQPGVKETLRIALAITEALGEAHGHQILHRDLKPENVLIPRDGRVRVVDFGLAKAVFSPEAEIAETIQHGMSLGSRAAFAQQFQTSGEGIAGTPLYMAPEQWLEQECTPATDVWALGVILYELLSGKRPHEGPTVFALCGVVCDKDSKAPPLEAEGVPSDLVDLVSRCLEKDPPRRPPTSEVLETLYSMVHRDRGRPEGEVSPFRGLLPFTERHADMFFGRDSEIDAFIERMRDEPVLPVVGPSGAGKSSFVQAGVIPRLREQGRLTVLTLRPGAKPFEALVSRLIKGESTGTRTSTSTKSQMSGQFSDFDGKELREEDLLGRLMESPARLSLFLQQIAQKNESRVLLLVDQLEELYTLVDDETKRLSFMEAVCGAADDPDGPVRVVFTARDDFLGKLAESEAAREALSRVTVIRAPGAEAMREILSQPLERVGYRYHDEKLVNEMIEAVYGESAGLPLLQFACAQMWERRDKDRKLLTRAAYKSIGGVEGALAHHADGVLEGLSAADVWLAREIFLRLVTSEGTRRTVTRGDLLQGLSDGASDLLDRLIQTRTITLRKSRKGDTDDAELELAHESLIRTWGRLRRWIEESYEDLAFLDEVGKAAELWQKRGRRSDEVWTGDALNDALRKAARVENVPQLIEQFLASGQELAGRRSRRKRIIVTIVIIVLSVIAVVLAWQNQEAKRQKKYADDQRILVEKREKEVRTKHAQSLRESGEYALTNSNTLEARAKLRSTIELGDSTLGRALWSRLTKEPLVWETQTPPAFSVVGSPQENWLVVATGASKNSIYVVDVRDGSVIRQMDCSYASGCWWVHKHPHPDRVLVSGTEHMVVLEVSTGKVLATTPFGEGSMDKIGKSVDGNFFAVSLNGAGFSVWDISRQKELIYIPLNVRSRSIVLNREKLVVAGADDLIRIWDLPHGKLIKEISLFEKPKRIQLDVEGKLLAVSCESGGTSILDLRTGKVITKLQAHEGTATAMRFSPKGPVLATAGNDRKVRTWDISTSRMLAEIETDSTPTDMVFSPNGNFLTITQYGGKVTHWDLSAWQRREEDRGQPGLVGAIAITRDGGIIASGSVFTEGPVFLWDPKTGQTVGQLSGHKGSVHDLDFDRTGNYLAAGDSSGRAVIWRVDSGQIYRTFLGHANSIYGVSLSETGRFLVTASGDGTARIWDVKSSEIKVVLEGHEGSVMDVKISPDEKTAATASSDKTVRIWSLRDGKLEKILSGHKGGVNSVAFSPDGSLIASGDSDKIIRLWKKNGQTSNVFKTLEPEWATGGDFLNSLVFSPDGKILGAATESGMFRTWDVQTGEEESVMYADGWASLGFDFSGDGKYAVTNFGFSPGIWEVNSGKWIWRTALTMKDKAIAYTHKGWIDLHTGLSISGPPKSKWRDAVESHARSGSSSTAGSHVCLVTQNGEVELWNTETDSRIVTVPAAANSLFVGLRTLPTGCIFEEHLDNKAIIRFARKDGSTKVLSDSANGFATGKEHIFVFKDKELIEFDHEANMVAKHVFDRDVENATRVREGLVVFFSDQKMALFEETDRGPKFLRAFDGVPSGLGWLELVAGPGKILLGNHPSGFVGVWDVETGKGAEHFKISGRPQDWFFDGDIYIVTTTTGDSIAIDLSVYTRPYCDLMREVWDEVPIIWENGKTVLAEPPEDHPCNAASQ